MEPSFKKKVELILKFQEKVCVCRNPKKFGVFLVIGKSHINHEIHANFQIKTLPKQFTKFIKFTKFTKFIKFTKFKQFTEFTKFKKFTKFKQFTEFTKFSKFKKFTKFIKFT